MSGGKITKQAKEIFLKEDIELHRQRTIDNYTKKGYKEERKDFENEKLSKL